jgi:hypothetical protein
MVGELARQRASFDKERLYSRRIGGFCSARLWPRLPLHRPAVLRAPISAGGSSSGS